MGLHDFIYRVAILYLAMESRTAVVRSRLWRVFVYYKHYVIGWCVWQPSNAPERGRFGRFSLLVERCRVNAEFFTRIGSLP